MGFLHPKKKLIRVADLPAGIRRIALARTVRWFGWGFGEALIPLFILQFSRSFAEAGAFRAAYDATMLLALPIIGMLADRVSARFLIIVALIIYPWVGVGYYLAGALGLGIFIILARVVNGLTWGLENVGVNTYFRRLSPRNLLGSSFGFIDTWSNFGWILAALIGMVLAPHVPTHILLAAVIPTSIVALLIARRVPKDIVRATKKPRPSILASYKLLA